MIIIRKGQKKTVLLSPQPKVNLSNHKSSVINSFGSGLTMSDCSFEVYGGGTHVFQVINTFTGGVQNLQADFPNCEMFLRFWLSDLS